MTVIDSPNPQAQKIAIIGDLIIDETWYTNTMKISPEAPIPVATLTTNRPIQTPGGAGLAARYAVKHNIPIELLSALSLEAESLLIEMNIPYRNICPINQNTKKIRYIDKDSSYHLLRVDNDDLITRPDPNKLAQELKKYINTIKPSCLALLDYRKGVLSNRNVCQTLIKEMGLPVFVDTRGDTTKFRGCSTTKLNLKECKAATKAMAVTISALREILSADNLIITKAAKGAEAYTSDTIYDISIPIVAGTPDVTGAGDVFDINFCYYYYIMKNTLKKSLEYAVNRATEFVRQPVESRLL